MSKRADERVKLTATFLNGTAIAAIVAGVVAPLVAWSYGLPSAVDGRRIVLIGFAWLSASVGLHLLGRWMLRALSE